MALLWGVMVVVLVLHNIEEYLLDLPEWVEAHSVLPDPGISQAQFGLAALTVTVAVAAIAVIALSFDAGWSADVLSCLAWVLLINAVGHVLVSVLSWSLMPGVISALLVLLPLGLAVLRYLPRFPWTPAAALSTVAAAAAIMGGSFAVAVLVPIG